jgi:restriction system protein
VKKSAIDELRNRVLAALEDGSISDLKFFGQNTPEASAIMTELSKSKHLSKVGEDNRQRYLAARELAQIASDVKPEHGPRIWNLLDQFFIPYLSRTRAVIDVKSVIIPERMAAAGLLVKSTTVVWEAIVRKLGADWNAAYSIPPSIWEEIIAGAFNKAGFDEVVLTPRSGDYGRDVIAIKHGVGCIKIIGSVKAYKPDHLVKHDDVRALLGVMSGESNTSKGLITTTSNFAPRIPTDPFIKPFLPTRLQLVNGQRLRGWLTDLAEKSEKAAR